MLLSGNGTPPVFVLEDLEKHPGAIKTADGRVLLVRSPSGFAQEVISQIYKAALAIVTNQRRELALEHNKTHPGEEEPVPDAMTVEDLPHDLGDRLMKMLVPDFTDDDIGRLTPAQFNGIIEIAQGHVKRVEGLIAAGKARAAALLAGLDPETTSATSSSPSPEPAAAVSGP